VIKNLNLISFSLLEVMVGEKGEHLIELGKGGECALGFVT